MPTLITNRKNNPKQTTPLYNYETAAADDFEMQETSIEELQERCRKYEEMIATLDSPLQDKMVRATSFRVDALRDMLDQNPSSAYVRVYNGIDTAGNHMLFMAPASQSGMSFAEDNTIWLDDCCRCPPMGELQRRSDPGRLVRPVSSAKGIEKMWLALIHFSLLLLNISLWAVKYRVLGRELRLLGILLLITFLVEGYATYLMFRDTRNLYLYHILTPLQYMLCASVLRMAIQTGWVKRLITLSIPVYLLISLLVTLYVQGTWEYNSYALMLKSFLITGWVLYYFVEVFSTLHLHRLETEPMFWVCTGLLFYSLGSFFLEGLMNYLLLQEHAYTLNLYYASLLLGYLLYSAFIVAFVLEKKRDKKLSP